MFNWKKISGHVVICFVLLLIILHYSRREVLGPKGVEFEKRELHITYWDLPSLMYNGD
jgi:hypothetical protein